MLPLKNGAGGRENKEPSYRKSHLLPGTGERVPFGRWFCFLSESRDLNFAGGNCDEEVLQGPAPRRRPRRKCRGGAASAGDDSARASAPCPSAGADSPKPNK